MTDAPPRGSLVVISGPSGVGKGSVVHRLLEVLPGTRFSVSVTTRPPRAREVPGIDYHFVDDRYFDRMIERGELLEWAVVHTARYGTPRAWVERHLSLGEDVLLEIDVQGALQIAQLTDRPPTVLVFLEPPSHDELVRRLRRRGTEDEDDIALRLRNAETEMAAADRFDHVIVNDDLDRAVHELATLLRARGVD